MTSVAVIGAGLSGLVLAERLAPRFDVTIFEKSGRAGGRLTSRRAGPWCFDHGAQFFVERRRDVQPLLDRLVNAGVIGCWNARFTEFRGATAGPVRVWSEAFPHYVGLPAMEAIGAFLARDLTVVLNTAVAAVERCDSRWRLRDPAGAALGEVDWVVAAAPGPQSAALVAGDALNARARGQPPLRACNALMLGFDAPQPLAWQAALVRDADLSWLSVNSSKPGREEPFSLVALSTNAWADAHFGLDDAQATEHLLREVERVAGIDVAAAAHVDLKRWRYANVARQTAAPCFIDRDQRVAACGDWFVQGRVEGAVASAQALAEAMLKG
ncbi:MAG: FAD-dependent oxidoreductase [Pseudomonadota bacterium]